MGNSTTENPEKEKGYTFDEVVIEEWKEIQASRKVRIPRAGAGKRKAASQEPEKAYTSDEVVDAEWKEIQASRETRAPELATCGDMPKTVEERNLVGLAFSGGGIRSATFNLGVLQALARLDLLKRIDYLSCVSGGNYIGNWLAAWIQRKDLGQVVQQLSPDRAIAVAAGGAKPVKPAREEEAGPIRWLREYSNYLTPRLGLFSGDTWTAVATYLRNMMLNLTVLALALATILLVPRVMTWFASLLAQTSEERLSAGSAVTNAFDLVQSEWSSGVLWLLIAAVLLLIIGIWLIAKNMDAFATPTPATSSGASTANGGQTPPNGPTPGGGQARAPTAPPVEPTGMAPWKIIGGILAPFVIAAWLLSCWLALGPACQIEESSLKSALTGLIWAGLFGILYAIPWIFGAGSKAFQLRVLSESRKSSDWPIFWMLVEAVPAGALGGIFFWRIAVIFQSWKPWEDVHEEVSGLWKVMTFGPPLVLVALTVAAVLHIGLMGIDFGDAKREWWSRMGGAMLVTSLSWIALFGISVWGPLGLMWLGGRLSGGVLAGWAATTVGGVLGGKSDQTGNPGGDTRLEKFLTIAPFVFIVGFLLLLSFGVHWVLTVAELPADSFAPVVGALTGHGEDWATSQSIHWKLMKDTRNPWLLAALLGAFGLACWFSERVDINEFSLHMFYRNRLSRCYQGASLARRAANWFTGFCADDDLFLAGLSARAESLKNVPGKPMPYVGPYLLINTALNLTSGEDLAWQSRKARSFIFSPRFCGFEVLPEEKNSAKPQAEQNPRLVDGGYRETLKYAYLDKYGLGGPLAGTAMAISGAAASPNMGYHSSPQMAFLMTVFNVRLGMWIGNSRHVTCWSRLAPPVGLPYLINELVGTANDQRGFVNLSDGGHFENLGIYELVRRRCKYILACDAGADPDMTFEDLGNAIQKCRIDFGVDIEIDISPLKRKSGTRFSLRHYAVGKIHYEQAFGAEELPGTLVYLKASLIDDMPADLLHYMEENKAFPHTTTANQFFDETQFESYRELGYTALNSIPGIALPA